MKRLLIAIVTATVAVLLTASVAFATHPGQNRNGDQPQGPHQTACENQGRQGVDVAIGSGGSVHCEGAVTH